MKVKSNKIPAILVFTAAPMAVFSAKALVIFLLALFLYLLFTKKIAPIKELFKSQIIIAFLLFMTYAFASIYWSVNPSYSFENWSKILAFTLVGIVVIGSFKGLEIPSKLIFISIFITCVMVILELLSQGYLSKIITPLLGSEKIFGLYMLNRVACILTLFIWVAMVFYKKSCANKSLYSALFIVSAAAIFMSESSTAKLAFICASLAFAISFISRGFLDYIMLGATLLMVILFAPIISKIDINELNSSAENIPLSAQHRILIWQFTAEKSQENSMLGHGFKASRYVGGASEIISGKEDIGWVNIPNHPHNFALQLLLELGIIGLALYLSFLICILRAIKTRISDNLQRSSYIAAFIAYITIAMTGFGMWQEWWLASVILAAAIMQLAPALEKD